MTPRDDQYADVLRRGLVVLDTNALLNLYRYHNETREDLFAILEVFETRLFIPHQVATEFWRNRESAIRGAASAATDLMAELDGHGRQAEQSIAAWAERSGLTPQRSNKLQTLISSAFVKVREQVSNSSSEGVGLGAIDTNGDPILARLLKVTNGKVGLPYLDARQLEHEQEAQRRIDAEQPPGYKDRTKRRAGPYGDYLVWRQVLDEAKQRRLDLLLVTGDLKEDWWRRESGGTRGPRLELAEEFSRETRHRLFMVRPAGLLFRARGAFDLHIRQESVDAADRVDRYAFARERRLRNEEAGLSPLVKLPEGKRGDYLGTLIEMTELAQRATSFEEFIESFREAFPTISRFDEARRRVGILSKLGLVTIGAGGVELTGPGARLLAERSLSILQEQFMARIAGAEEIRARVDETSVRAIRDELRDTPPGGITTTQAGLILDYLVGLRLVPALEDEG